MTTSLVLIALDDLRLSNRELIEEAVAKVRAAEVERPKTKRQVADHYGVTPATIDRDKGIPFFVVGSHRRYLLSEVDAYFRGKQSKTAEPEPAKPSSLAGVRLVSGGRGGAR